MVFASPLKITLYGDGVVEVEAKCPVCGSCNRHTITRSALTNTPEPAQVGDCVGAVVAGKGFGGHVKVDLTLAGPRRCDGCGISYKVAPRVEKVNPFNCSSPRRAAP